MLPAQKENNEAAIMGRLFESEIRGLPRVAANAILAIEFSSEDKDRMNALAAKARAGNLTPRERKEIDCYSRVGSLLSIFKSKVRKSLMGRRSGNGKGV